MCEVIGQAMAMAVSRRSLLKGAGAAAAAGAVGAGLGPA
jgi:secreted PhoX family phosphatase